MKPEQIALVRKAQTSLQAAQLLAGQGFADFAASRAYCIPQNAPSSGRG